MSKVTIPYDYKNMKRENAPYYIPASKQDIDDMLSFTNSKSLEDLYSHIDDNFKFSKTEHFIDGIENYEELAQHVYDISLKNKQSISLIGNGLHQYTASPIINDICSIRGLTTAYTPYQPEKSQGTLKSLWIYQSLLKEITGFEAINASLYDRSTGIFEAIKCALRISKSDKKVLVIDSLYSGDKNVLETLLKHTGIVCDYLEMDSSIAQSTQDTLKSINATDYCAIVFSQVTNYGTLENVDLLADFASENNLLSVAVIDPILLINDGLKKPIEYGTDEQGVNIITGDAHSLSLDKNFGGPGLGIFGVRFNSEVKNHIRQTPGRFVGRAKDLNGLDCLTLILSTREQHIRKDKATSNICSNQSFIASLAGANLLHWGSKGLEKKVKQSRSNALQILQEVLTLEGIELAFKTPFYNEVSLKLDCDLKILLNAAKKENIELGVIQNNCLKMFFSDDLTQDHLNKITTFFKTHFKASNKKTGIINEIPSKYITTKTTSFEAHSDKDVINFYEELGKLNFSPDDGVYPLGSCTMKYNPHINDFCASYPGFTKIHPETNEEFCQGSLEILFEVQEFFKKVTGLAGVTTQPVAGAQGELVGLKMFQAYHFDKGEKRKYILIPKSAHGTNPATANVAGYQVKYLDADPTGQIDLHDLKNKIKEFGQDIAGIMITNPNTSGVFEENFKLISDLLHDIDALVYMDGANMNAIAGHINLNKLGVDAVHNNLHKTWTIPHGGGGPGDGMVAVSERLIDYMPGKQITKSNEVFSTTTPLKTIGSFHRHWGNFAHKVRCYTYIKALGSEGVRKMSAIAVLSSKYLFYKLKGAYPFLPTQSAEHPRMHEFIITLNEETFQKIQDAGVPKASIIGRIGKLFLDFGFHAPTVSFPEVYGLMIEPTESFTKAELDKFADAVLSINEIINSTPSVLLSAPHFTPISRIDEVTANKKPVLSEDRAIDGLLFKELDTISEKKENLEIKSLSFSEIKNKILDSHVISSP